MTHRAIEISRIIRFIPKVGFFDLLNFVVDAFLRTFTAHETDVRINSVENIFQVFMTLVGEH